MNAAHKLAPIARWKLALVMAAFFASWFIVKPIWHLFDLHGPAQRAIPLAIPALATFVFVRSMMAISPRNPALRRYGWCASCLPLRQILPPQRPPRPPP